MKGSRRRFLGQASCAAVSSIPVLNTLLNLKAAGHLAAAAPGPSDYRALVCLFFSGGIDSFNLLAPRGTSEWQQYKGIRGDLAIPSTSLLPITPTNITGMELGVHPGMAGIQSLFEAGNAAFVSNVGTLVEPVTKTQYFQGTGKFPLGLFSHSDQIEQWQTGTPDVRSPRGWAGRVGDVLKQLNTDPTVSMNISLAGANIWQSGETVYEYAVSAGSGDWPGGAEELQGYDPSETSDWSTIVPRTRAVDGQLALEYQHLLTEAFASKKRDAMAAFQLFNSATSTPLPTGVTFPGNYLAEQFKMVAKSVAGHAALGHVRQTFFVHIGGWDHHDEVLANMGELMPVVSGAVSAFYAALTALGMADSVTLFTASDFGRTLTSNGAGSDHAWGGNHFVVGGAVDGRKVYGQFPELYEDNPLDVGRGRLIPSTSVDAYFAELALWLGVPKSSLPLVLPNIERFYSLSSSSNPVGFLP
jgi:uncharacterized protein (DUF1501 family)